MPRTFGITRFYQSNGIAPHEMKHRSIGLLMSSMVRADEPAKYFTFSQPNSLLIEEAIEQKQKSITIEQLFLHTKERLVINLIDNTIVRYTRLDFAFSDIISTLVEVVNYKWTSLQNPEWPFHVVIYNHDQGNRMYGLMNKDSYTIHNVRIENNRVFCPQGIIVIKNPEVKEDIHNPLEILYIGRKNYNERKDVGKRIKLVPFNELYFVMDKLTHSFPQSMVISVEKPHEFAKIESTDSIDGSPVKVINNRVYSDEGVYDLVPIDGFNRNDPKLVDAGNVLKIAKIKAMIDGGLDESFFNLKVKLRLINYRPCIYWDDNILYLDKLNVSISQTMKETAEQFQKVVFQEFMEKTHHPARAVNWCFDEDERKRMRATFDMTQDSGSGSLDQ